MLEHIEEEYVGRVRVRHNMQVQQLAAQPGGTVSLKWAQANPTDFAKSKDAKSPGPGGLTTEGVAQAEFLACGPLG